MLKVLKSIFISLMLLLVCFIIGFFLTNIIMKTYVHHGESIPVPKIIGKRLDTAKRILENDDLYLKVIKREHNKDFKEGYIIKQNPRADIETKKNRTIEVVLSKGQQKTTIPALVNQSATEASVILESSGLKLGEKHHRYSDSVPKGKIIKSQPFSGQQVPKGEKIAIYISLGKLPDSENKQNKYMDLLND